MAVILLVTVTVFNSDESAAKNLPAINDLLINDGTLPPPVCCRLLRNAGFRVQRGGRHSALGLLGVGVEQRRR